jgi:hypothetical protein
MLITDIHNEFFNNGFCKFNDPEVFKFLHDIDSWEWKNWKDQGLQLIKRNHTIESAIIQTQKYIGEKYICKLDENYVLGDECEIVNGMDDATLTWHNDNIEGYNLCVLLYFDSMDEDIGGMTRFRDINTKKLTGEFYPQQYDVSFMNHCLRFQHVVTPLILDMPRRVALFNYKINEILTG